MTRIILIRHCEAEGNIKRVFPMLTSVKTEESSWIC